MAPLGRAALLLAFGLVAYALVAGSYAAWKRRRRLALSAQNALLAAFPVTLVAAIVLFVALGRRDMTFVYVWQHTSHKLPLGYALSAFWGGQEGSLMLWLLVLTGYAGLAVWLNRRSRELIAWTVPVFGLIAVFFAFMLCFVSSPFNVQPPRADGNGMVPSLQNPYMLAHPPLLYLGYVGLSVPFAFAMGALLSGRTDERWIVATRRWTLAAWTFLGVGQLIGAHWAYVEIGWGGYYAWDPVENAALMPWLAATAFLHSVMIQEKRGMLKVWNMILVALAFNLSLFGTFLTRSGVIDSIHSFSKSSIGGWFLAFLGLMVFCSIALIRWRLPLLRTKTKLESLVSREATFLYNNLLLVALCLTILWGVLYPILTDAVRGQSRSVAGPYYDFFLHTFGLPLLLLMGIGPLVAWRRASLRSLGKTFVIPFTVAVADRRRAARARLRQLAAGSAHVHVLGLRRSLDRARVRARPRGRGRGVPADLPEPAALRRLRRARRDRPARDRDRGLERLPDAAGADSAAGAVDARPPATRSPTPASPASKGRTTTATGRSSRCPGTASASASTRGPTTTSSRASPTRRPSITPRARSATSSRRRRSPGTHTTNIDLKVFVKPLVNLIWVAGFVFVAGALIAMWPDAVEQRRLAARYAAGAAPAGI